MLQAIRTRAGSLIVKILFGLLILSFGIWGVGDIFRGRPEESVVAKVGKEKITAQELQKALEPALARLEEAFGRKFDLREAKRSGLVDSLVQGLVERSLVGQEVSRLGLIVSDHLIREAILGDPEFRTPQGRFDRVLFDRLLAANHLTEARYVARLKRGIPANQLLRAITIGAKLPPLLVDTVYRYENEKRVAALAFLPLSSAPSATAPDEAALRGFYEAHKSLFRAPEYRGFTLISLTSRDLAAKVTISEETLKKAYDKAGAALAFPERREVLQILASSEKQAKAAEKALASGEPFREVAAKVAAEAPDTVDLGLVSEKELPSPLAHAAFALKLNTPSQPIRSPFGWHIIEVVKIVPPGRESFAEAKGKLLALLQQRGVARRLYKIGEHVDDAIAGGLSLRETAKKFGLKVSVVKAVDFKGQDPAGKAIPLPVPSKRVLKLAFSSQKGRSSRVIHEGDGAIFALEVERIIAPHVKSFDHVKAEATAAFEAQQRREALEKEAALLAASVSPQQTLAAAAAAKGIAVSTAILGREGNGKVPLGLVEKLFAAKKGQAVAAVTKKGAWVAELLQKERPKAAAKAATAALARSLTGEERSDLGAEFAAALRARFPVKIYPAVIDRMF